MHVNTNVEEKNLEFGLFYIVNNRKVWSLYEFMMLDVQRRFSRSMISPMILYQDRGRGCGVRPYTHVEQKEQLYVSGKHLAALMMEKYAPRE